MFVTPSESGHETGTMSCLEWFLVLSALFLANCADPCVGEEAVGNQEVFVVNPDGALGRFSTNEKESAGAAYRAGGGGYEDDESSPLYDQRLLLRELAGKRGFGERRRRGFGERRRRGFGEKKRGFGEKRRRPAPGPRHSLLAVPSDKTPSGARLLLFENAFDGAMP
ncbi:uncharacterized protein LOC144180339 isoform X2 [Haemaphysalis longicornis]